MKDPTCETCGIPFSRKETGRPRLYCSDRCKEKAKRKRAREEERASVTQLGSAPYDEGPETCHICGLAPALIGTPKPLICSRCSARATG